MLHHLPERDRPTVKRRLRRAWADSDHDRGARRAPPPRQRARPLPPRRGRLAAGGLEETLTLTRLGVGGQLKRTLESTNPCESMIECVRRSARNVKRWQSGDMAPRWTAAGMLEAERQFRRIIGHRDLDITLEKYRTAKTFLTRVFGEIAADSRVHPNDLLTEGAVDRLVLASGGVARDFLSIANKAISVARERGETYRGVKVNTEDVNQACGEHEGTKREELSSDAGGDEGPLIEEFERIRQFCLEDKHVNCFLLEKDLPAKGYGHIQELVDLRLLHIVKSRVTVRERPGKTYEAYLLDFSQYTGERKKRDMKILEFWKTGADDELRRRALIYEPS